MASWESFAQAEPRLAALGERLLRVGGDKPTDSLAAGLAYLATVRKDGGPRIHPISPALINRHLYAFILKHSPKRFDLLRDGRYALHSFPYPMDEQAFTDEEFYLSGQAALVDDVAIRHAVATATGDAVEDGLVFELTVESVLHKGRMNGRAVYTKWRYDRSMD